MAIRTATPTLIHRGRRFAASAASPEASALLSCLSHQAGCIMKTSLVLLTVFIVVLLSISLVLANPALLPKHPGYPIGKAVDPVSG